MSESYTFDTHKFVKRLTEVGLDERIAETLADEQVKLLTSQLATKAELANIARDINRLRKETQASIERLRQETQASIEQSKQETQAAIAQLRKETQTGIEQLRKETQTGIEQLRKETKTGIERMRQDTANQSENLRLEVDYRIEKVIAEVVRWIAAFGMTIIALNLAGFALLITRLS